MVGWHHRLNRHEFEQTPGDSEGQGSLVCCSPWALQKGAPKRSWRRDLESTKGFVLEADLQAGSGVSNEYSGLISFRMNWLDLFAVQGTRRSLLRHHSSEASILRRSAFFTVQLSHPYMTGEAMEKP